MKTFYQSNLTELPFPHTSKSKMSPSCSPLSIEIIAIFSRTLLRGNMLFKIRKWSRVKGCRIA